jgi:glucokinase
MIRRGTRLRRRPVLAIDIGATKVDLALVVNEREIVASRRVAVADYPTTLFESIVENARFLIEESPHRPRSVGVACAGPMTSHGETVSPLNIPQWREFALRDRLAEALQMSVHVDGDVRALALAEGRFGAGRGCGSYLSMVVSTGIGGALVMDGRLCNGDSGNAGHVGHVTVIPYGAPCSCGSFGCLEAEASGWAIERLTGQPASQADSGTRDRVADLVGRGVGTLASVLDVNHCFVAGSVALGFGAPFFERATSSARSVATMAYSRQLTIQPSALGREGSILGAAQLARRGAK